MPLLLCKTALSSTFKCQADRILLHLNFSLIFQNILEKFTRRCYCILIYMQLGDPVRKAVPSSGKTEKKGKAASDAVFHLLNLLYEHPNMKVELTNLAKFLLHVLCFFLFFWGWVEWFYDFLNLSTFYKFSH